MLRSYAAEAVGGLTANVVGELVPLHETTELLRSIGGSYDDLMERYPTLKVAGLGLTLATLPKRIAQKAIALAIGATAGMGAAEIIDAVRRSHSDRLSSYEDKLQISRTDTVTYLSLALGLSTNKLVGGGRSSKAGRSSKDALVGKKRILTRQQQAEQKHKERATGKKGAPKRDKPKNLVDVSNFSEDSLIKPLDRKGGEIFDGVEFRGVRDLSHMSEVDLRIMYQRGRNPIDKMDNPLRGHHHKQRYHRYTDSFIVEIDVVA
jgi:hypothetical protein